MKTLIDSYIKSNVLAWSTTTQTTARASLNAVASAMDGNPLTLWNEIQNRKPYTRQTIWIRVSLFWGWCNPKADNPYVAWRKANAMAFKNAYTKERIEITYEEAKVRISAIADLAIQKRALEILGSGQRYAESCQSGAEILGKGSKPRPNFRPELAGPPFDQSYHTFYRALRQVGLKPHTLRKLALTRMVDKGATVYDIMEVAGWSSIQTASSYIQPKETARLKDLLKD